jgi:hypothetical protein
VIWERRRARALRRFHGRFLKPGNALPNLTLKL